MIKTPLRTLCLSLLMLTAGSAWADDSSPKNNTVALGYYFVFYHTEARDLSGPFTPQGAGLDVRNLETPYFSYYRRFVNHFGVELAAGVPPLTKSEGKGPATLGSVPYNGVVISTARWFAPSLLLRYTFLDEGYWIHPYLAVGLNYVNFYNRNSTPAGNAAAGGPTRIELPSSYGIAGNAGLSFSLPDNFSVMLSYSAARVTTHLTAITGDVARTSYLSFNPQTVVLAAGYSF
ncbi:MAG TPA: OmpW family outer membrane protein [Steroidobacteraceae bacterium]|nr:OmpW family outer membrane protein [Steroidobacteraceae bacterium]